MLPHPFIARAELESGEELPDGAIVDLEQAGFSGEAPVEITAIGDGVVVDFAPGKKDVQPSSDNLAVGMDETKLTALAVKVIEWVDADIKAREPWFEKLKDGLSLLGVIPSSGDEGPFKLTSKVNHPLLAEAAVQFQARAITEMIPPEGPAKAVVLGASSKELEDQSTRVKDYLNYQLMVEDTDYFGETDKMLFCNCLEGSQFKKVYTDPNTGKNVSRWVRPEELIVPYSAITLASAQRYTHKLEFDKAIVKNLQASGFYRDVALSEPSPESTSLSDKQDEAQGLSRDNLDDDTPHTLYECYCTIDVGDGDLPYIVTVEKDSRKVLAIRADYDEQTKMREETFVHFPHIPGDGFYSYGLYHLIGGLGHAATGLLRSIMVGAAFSSMSGGFKSKDAKLPSDVELEYGKWQDCELSADELSKAFFTPPFKEPGVALFNILGLVVESGRRFASTTEAIVGDASNTGPVGTTVALIEQGMKVFSGIHKRLHYAQGKELKILARLNGKTLPVEGYPYRVVGAERSIARADFDDRVDVIPVSDPNIFSSTQRMAIAQAIVQRADAKPSLYDAKKVELRILEAMRVPDAELLLVNDEVGRMDALTENAFIVMGKPVKAHADEDHQAHMAIHAFQRESLVAQKHPLLNKLLPVMFAHEAEHMAHAVYLSMAQQMGVELPPLGEKDVDPEIQNAITQRAAMVVAQMPKQQAQADDGKQAELAAMAEKLGAQEKAVIEKENAVAEEMKKLESTRKDVSHEAQMKAMEIKNEGMIVQRRLEKLQDEITRLKNERPAQGNQEGS